MDAPANTENRLGFIDWTRGLGALIMLQGHSFHSFTRNDLRNQGPYVLSQFVGGVAPAIFLFLTGVTFSFLMHSAEKKGLSNRDRIRKALRRSAFLFLLAFLFRAQLFLFGYPHSPASELLKVDVLNCMGLSMLLFAPMAVFTSLERIRLCAILGAVIAALSPLISTINSTGMPALVRAYFVPSYNYFSFFPWASFLAFGMSAGSLLRTTKQEEMGRLMQWLMLIGIGLIVGGQYFSSLPYSLYTKSEFWLDSPGLAAIKLGVVLSILSFAYVWLNLGTTPRWSLLRQLGTTSLLVYWVHIELVYGRWFGFWKEALTIPQVTLFAVVLIVAMTGLSIWRKRPPKTDSYPRRTPVAVSSGVSGD